MEKKAVQQPMFCGCDWEGHSEFTEQVQKINTKRTSVTIKL